MKKDTKRNLGIVSVCVIALAVAAWALIPSNVAPSGKVKIGAGIVYGASEPTYSGIENIYIVDNDHAAGWEINFSGNENVLGVIEASEGSCDIAYDTAFVIVVAVKGHDENMAYVQEENLQVELAVSGSFTITQENSADENEYVFVDGTPDYIRVNVVWDNATNGYILPASGSISLDPVKLWCWG